MRWRALAPAALVCLGASAAGAWAVTVFSPQLLRLALPWLLVALLVYTSAKKALGRVHRPRFGGRRETLAVCALALAIGWFAWSGHVWWHYAAAMALANVAGSVLGTRLALRHGAGFVRSAFLVVVALLILKTGWDAYGALG